MLAISPPRTWQTSLLHPSKGRLWPPGRQRYNRRMKKTAVLGGLTPKKFMAEYWHKKPCLIRQAFPDFLPLLSRDTLFELAQSDLIETRLITHFERKWAMQHGPHQKLPSVSKKQWTLLVQGINLHDDRADALLRQFNFLPDARLDDLMISYATDGGGVGPHVDSYDVFLIQAHGTRRWRISAQQDLTLQKGLPLKILQRFVPEQEFDLLPGDMLYLPPNYAHDGVAIGECMTYSIGFRAPAYQDLGEQFLQFMAESIELDGRYADPDLAPVTRPAEISSAMLKNIATELNKITFSAEDIAIFLGEYLSEPKAQVVFDAPSHMLSIKKFVQTAGNRGIRLARQTQMLYRSKLVFINGESFTVCKADQVILAELANQRRLDASAIVLASQDVIEALYDWYRQGWATIDR